MTWPKEHTLDNAEVTLEAFVQAVETIADLTGLPPGQVEGRLLGFMASGKTWEVREWQQLVDAVNDG